MAINFRLMWIIPGLLLSGFMSAQPSDEVGTYNLEQAVRGSALYATHCSACHGSALEGGVAAALSGTIFKVIWSRPTVTVDDLHFIISTTMPVFQGGSLSDTEYLDILAYILEGNGVPAGAEPLRMDRKYLSAIKMATDEDIVSLSPPSFIAGEQVLTPSGTGPSSEELLAASPDGANWLHYTRDYEGTRYSPLSEINTSNAANLSPQCIFQVGVEGPFQTGPIVYEGIMYINGVHATMAIDPVSCKTIWRYEWEVLDRESWSRNRGVAIQDAIS